MFEIDGRRIGADERPYVVAEMSANHNNSFDRACRILEAAHEAGADAIKLQTYTPEGLTIESNREYFEIEGTSWDGRTLYDLYDEGQTPWEWHEDLQSMAKDLEMDFFSSPFSKDAVDFLETLDVPVYKIASFENVDLPLIQYVAQTGKPIIMSTGMATLGEIEEAVFAARKAGAEDIALLKCTSAYPAPVDEMNLSTIPHLSDAFDTVVGLSDHTMEVAVPVTAVTLGASIVEKHLTLSREEEGVDSDFSLEPDEFSQMVDAVHASHKAVGEVAYATTEREEDSIAFRRSLFVVDDVRAGEKFTDENVRVIRPGYGLHPRYLDTFLGREASCDISRGTPLSWEHLGSNSQ